MTRSGMWRMSVWQTVVPSPRPSAAERAGLAASPGSEDPHVAMKIQASFRANLYAVGLTQSFLALLVFFFSFFFTF